MAKEPFDLQNWCDTWLSDKHWLRLKRAVWATKKRNRDKEVYEIKKQNRMSKKAWSVLSHEATRQNISMSDLVLKTFQIKESSKKR